MMSGIVDGIGEKARGECLSKTTSNWIHEFPGAITVCDATGIILSMNARAAQVFIQQGGDSLIGKSLMDCHPEPARQKIEKMLRDQKSNAYTIEKEGKKKLIYQSPWYQEGAFAGIVELSFEIPFEMPHFVRKSQTAQRRSRVLKTR
jgi:transcriptional regulator with PAS, ATPase and Fis domain